MEPFLDDLATALADAGLAPMPARVFAALLGDADGRMTAAELAEGLAISAGAVSGAVRYLEHVGWIHRERTPGRRFDTYVVEDDAWHAALIASDRTYAPMLAALDRGLAELDPDAPARVRLELSREFLTFVQAELTSLARRWERHRRAFLRTR